VSRRPNLVGRGSRQAVQLNRSSQLSQSNDEDVPKSAEPWWSAGSRLGAFNGATHYILWVCRFALVKHVFFREPRPTKLGLQSTNH